MKKDLPAVKKHIVSLIEGCNRAISAMQGVDEDAAAFIAIMNRLINYQSLIVVVEEKELLN